METILNLVVTVGATASVGMLLWGAVLTARHLLGQSEPRLTTDPIAVSDCLEQLFETAH